MLSGEIKRRTFLARAKKIKLLILTSVTLRQSDFYLQNSHYKDISKVWLVKNKTKFDF